MVMVSIDAKTYGSMPSDVNTTGTHGFLNDKPKQGTRFQEGADGEIFARYPLIEEFTPLSRADDYGHRP
jgi:hypothetical protein